MHRRVPFNSTVMRLSCSALAAIAVVSNSACTEDLGGPPEVQCLAPMPLTTEFRELPRAPSNYRDLFVLIDPRHPDYTYGYLDKRAHSAWFRGPDETIGYCSYAVEPGNCFQVVAVFARDQAKKWELRKMVGQSGCGLVLP